MNRMVKRNYSKKLILTLVLGFVFVIAVSINMYVYNVNAEDTITYPQSGKCGENATWEMTGDGVLTISGNGPMYDWGRDDYTADGEDASPWFDMREDITKIIIGNGITHVGDRSFSFNLFEDYNKIVVIIGDDVQDIGFDAFYAINTDTITFPQSLKSIGSHAFAHSTVSTVIMDEGVENIEMAAFWNSNLKEITLPKSLKYIGVDAFESTPWLNLSKNNREDHNVIVNNILIYLNVEEDAEKITIPDEVVSIQGVVPVHNVKEIIFPDTIKYIGDCSFEYCQELETLELPQQLEYIGDNAFIGCKKIKEINIPEKVKHIGAGAFSGVQRSGYNSVEKYEVDPDNIYFHTMDNGNAIVETATKTLVCGTKNTKITENIEVIGPSAFFWVELRDIEIPTTVSKIDDKSFYNCALTEIVIPNTVSDIGNAAFSYCENLKKVTLPANFTKINNSVFAYCKKLSEINLPRTITYIGEQAFYHCEELEDIVFPENLSYIGSYAFDSCAGSACVSIPEKVRFVGSGAFSYWNKIETVEVLNTKDVEIKSLAFDGCNLLSKMLFYNCDLGNNINGHIYTILGDNSIYKDNCKQLEGEWWDNIFHKTFGVVHSHDTEIHIYALTKEQVEKNTMLPNPINDNNDEDKPKEGDEATSEQLITEKNNTEANNDASEIKNDNQIIEKNEGVSNNDKLTVVNIANKKTYKKSK